MREKLRRGEEGGQGEKEGGMKGGVWRKGTMLGFYFKVVFSSQSEAMHPTILRRSNTLTHDGTHTMEFDTYTNNH